ncbi:hypothetical protein ACFFRL_11450 [Agromyces hippuratus]
MQQGDRLTRGFWVIRGNMHDLLTRGRAIDLGHHSEFGISARHI